MLFAQTRSFLQGLSTDRSLYGGAILVASGQYLRQGHDVASFAGLRWRRWFQAWLTGDLERARVSSSPVSDRICRERARRA